MAGARAPSIRRQWKNWPAKRPKGDGIVEKKARVGYGIDMVMPTWYGIDKIIFIFMNLS